MKPTSWSYLAAAQSSWLINDATILGISWRRISGGEISIGVTLKSARFPGLFKELVRADPPEYHASQLALL